MVLGVPMDILVGYDNRNIFTSFREAIMKSDFKIGDMEFDI